ncbi:NADH dehydrogenase subunit 6 (mitochondrion) [Gavialis gangeticus]|uniref:NADH-ubiquinone oxidoreductase chain 6 n=1 Tax=Gavialis gangeticus TaxID=94835 RepID=Q335R9_GAVGA|nr:NADH dehydrogenase subunit 6 [Gavialis gangeticus]BAE97415.1 NADH dehydrogenase subunit 6 [Gavialis gangeticus]CAH18628.1 NADH dehydrogenase subunit 6 [Gavialis gangeticus]
MEIAFLFLCCLMLVGVVLVAAGATTHYGVVSLLFAAVLSSGLLVVGGGSFMPIVVLLIYLGGLLVVFAFCVGFTDDEYCEFWGTGASKGVAGVCGVGLMVMGYRMYKYTWVGTLGGFLDAVEVWSEDISNELLGVGLFYLEGWVFVALSGWALLIVLFVIMGLVRGHRRGALRSL